MTDLSVMVKFSDSIDAQARAFVDVELNVEGVTFSSSNNQLAYKGFGTSPENIIIECVGFIVLAFASGFAGKAGADAWDSLKERFKKVRERHLGGLEIEFLGTEGTSLVRYVIPESTAEAQVALDQVAQDLEILTTSDERERWWLGPPDSRWGTGLESIEYRNRKQ